MPPPRRRRLRRYDAASLGVPSRGGCALFRGARGGRFALAHASCRVAEPARRLTVLGLGMASSHAPMMFQKAQYWPRVMERLQREAREQLPRSTREEIATPAIIDEKVQRIEAAFAVLRGELRAYRPDALIMIGDDQGDMFDTVNNPTFSVYTGDEPIWGLSARDPFGTPLDERTKITFRQHGELARHLLRGLVKRGFDVANVGHFDPRGNPARGVSHMVSNLVPEVDPALQIPLVCV